jgi:ADP-heptose:LPS heptosyltransferase
MHVHADSERVMSGREAASADASRIAWPWYAVGAFMWLLSSAVLVIGRCLRTTPASGPERIPAADGERSGTIVVSRLDGAGDLIMTTGFLRQLRAGHERDRIILVVRKELANVVEFCPYVDEVYPFDMQCPAAIRMFVLPWRAAMVGLRLASAGPIALAINPRWDKDYSFNGLLVYFTRARRRIAFSEKVNPRKAVVNLGFDRLYTSVIDDRNFKHEVERGGVILRFLGVPTEDPGLELWLSDEDHEVAGSLCGSIGASLLVAIAPGASVPRRMWPVGEFARTARIIQERFNAGIIVLGSPGERPLADAMLRGLKGPAMSLAGRTTFREAAAVLRRCRLFIGNDSGLLHVAAAVGTATIEISCHPKDGPALDGQSPARFCAWGAPTIVVQPAASLAPCVGHCEAPGAHCICAVSVDDVLEAVEESIRTPVQEQSSHPIIDSSEKEERP